MFLYILIDRKTKNAPRKGPPRYKWLLKIFLFVHTLLGMVQSSFLLSTKRFPQTVRGRSHKSVVEKHQGIQASNQVHLVQTSGPTLPSVLQGEHKDNLR